MPPPVPVKKQPFVIDNAKMIILGAVLLVLFAVGFVLKNEILLWVYSGLAVRSFARWSFSLCIWVLRRV